MRIIDCHANVGWDSNNLKKNLFPIELTFKSLLDKMNVHKVEKSIILPFPSPNGQFISNEFWYETENHYLITASRFSSKLIPFPGVNPNDRKSVNNIRVMANAFKIKGVKLSHQIPMKFSTDKLIGHPLMKTMQDNGLLFMIHTGTGKEPGSQYFHETMEEGIKVARKYKDIKFIFCHLGRLHHTMIKALELENVYMDMSALSTSKSMEEFTALKPVSFFKNIKPVQVIEKIVDIGYEDKIIFGSDIPYAKYEEEIKVISDANISEKVKNKIFYDNIVKLLKLK